MKGVYGNNNRGGGGYKEAEESFFDEGYGSGGIGGHLSDLEFWVKCDEYDKMDQSEMTFQGRLHQKNLKTKKWQPYHFELYSDRLIRISSSNQAGATANANNSAINGNNDPSCNSINGDDACIEQASLNACYLKKIKYSDTSYANYKYGIRLQRGESKSELFTESADNFNKLYEEIKRFCILPKFSKKYKVLTKIKSSSVAHLYKCFRYSDSTQYCVKIVDKYALSDQGRAGVLRETSILRRVDHPSIVKLYEVYEDDTNVFLVYELLQGKDLRSKLTELLGIDEKSLSDFLWKLLHGLTHLHSRNVMHRDIRLENIFFRSPTSLTDACISNFNLAEFVDSSKVLGAAALLPPSKPNYKKHGTVGYLAPEVMKNKNYDQKVDIFSLGIIFYILVFGKPPFEGKDQDETMKLNEKCEIDFSQQPFYGKLTSSAFDLMKRMLDKDPKTRPEASQLLNHTWFVNMRNKTEESRQRQLNISSQNGINPNNSQNNIQMFSTLTTIEEGFEPAEDPNTDPGIQRGRVRNNNLNSNLIISNFNLSNQNLLTNNSNIVLNTNMNDSFNLSAYKDNSVLANYYNSDQNAYGSNIVVNNNILLNNHDNSNVQYDEFSDIKMDELPRSNYVQNIVKDGSLMYEDEFVKETLFDKMRTLNKLQFMKVPSKFRHDSFNHHVTTKLGLDLTSLQKKIVTNTIMSKNTSSHQETATSSANGNKSSSNSTIQQPQVNILSNASINNGGNHSQSGIQQSISYTFQQQNEGMSKPKLLPSTPTHNSSQMSIPPLTLNGTSNSQNNKENPQKQSNQLNLQTQIYQSQKEEEEQKTRSASTSTPIQIKSSSSFIPSSNTPQQGSAVANLHQQDQNIFLS